MRHQSTKRPALGGCFSPSRERWQVVGRPEVGLVTRGKPGYNSASLAFGTWRSPVAHCNGVAGVAGSNPAVPTRWGRPLVGPVAFPESTISSHRSLSASPDLNGDRRLPRFLRAFGRPERSTRQG